MQRMFMIAYANNTYQEPRVNVDGADRFAFQVNPESYRRRFGIQYANTARVPGQTGDAGTYHNTLPETFTVDILFDSSGVIADPGPISIAVVNPFASVQPEDVTRRIEKLKAFCYNFQSDPHRPYYVRLCWGDESGFFFGVVTTLEIEYKLFRPDGKPVRALAHLSLNEAEDRVLTDRRRATQSPDITHEKTIKAGDKLPLLSHTVYRNSGYYIDVARHNGLLSFRNIKEGRRLEFPPVK